MRGKDIAVAPANRSQNNGHLLSDILRKHLHFEQAAFTHLLQGIGNSTASNFDVY